MSADQGGSAGRPVAWERKWSRDGIEPMRGVRGWQLRAFTKDKLLADDEPVFAASPDCAQLVARNQELLEALKVVLDQVDYMAGACGLTEMVGACLPAIVIEKARAAIQNAESAP